VLTGSFRSGIAFHLGGGSCLSNAQGELLVSFSVPALLLMVSGSDCIPWQVDEARVAEGADVFGRAINGREYFRLNSITEE
jgi:hypothetical protein